jgi:hypothetical protein
MTNRSGAVNAGGNDTILGKVLFDYRIPWQPHLILGGVLFSRAEAEKKDAVI